MAITMNKKKAVSEYSATSELSMLPEAESQVSMETLGILIDEVGSLEAEAQKAKATLKKYDASKKKLLEMADLVIASSCKGLVVSGCDYAAEIGPRGSIRSVKNIAKAVVLLGEEVFLKLAKINLGDLEKYLTETQLDEVVEVGNTGSRSLKIVKCQGMSKAA